MRKVFLVLVLANVVAFIWYGWLRTPAETLHPMSPLPHVQSLRLISELTPAEKQALNKSTAPALTPAVTAQAVAPAGQNVQQVCASYGPFPSTEAAQTAIARLQKAGNQVTQRTVPGKVRLGYWV